MRRNAGIVFGVGEVVLELLPFGLLALDDARVDHTVFVQIAPQMRQQFGAFRKILGQNITRAVQRRFGIVDIRFGVEVLRRLGFGIERRIGQQCQRQRLQACFARDLRPRATFRLIRQIQILQHLLGHRRVNRRVQFGRQFALLINGFQNRTAALLQFAQITQALVQITQLRVIQTIRRLLTVTRNERHRRTFIQ